MIQPDSIGLYHPSNETEISELIQYAAKNNYQVRVRGASQSVDGAVYTDNFSPTNSPPNTTQNMNILLDKMRSVTQLSNNQVAVQAGCNIGYDPFDPSDSSTPENSLFRIINGWGLSIPDVPDATHQTVAGLITTGSSGGTVSHSFLNRILSIKLIDGNGELQTFNKPSPDNPDDPFYAVGVSLGLLGIITEVTLQCDPAFNIIGSQSITHDSEGTVDFYGNRNDGSMSVQDFFTNTEYSRLIWFPFYTVKRIITWQARKMQPTDYNANTTSEANFNPKPYKDIFPAVHGTEIPGQALADGFYSVIGNWPQILVDLLGNGQGPPDEELIPGKTTQDIEDIINKWGPKLLPVLLNMFIPLDGPDHPTQEFWDYWYGSLAMDEKEYSTNLFPSVRTGIWLPLENSEKVMEVFLNYFDQNNKEGFWAVADEINRNATNGIYPLEIHAASATNFWLSPGYQKDSIRINLMWFSNNEGDPKAYYQQFWDLFQKNNIDYTLHWGCTLPPLGTSETPEYITSKYPKFEEFLKLRSQMDPKNIFLSTYWKDQLGIKTN